ncbi:hypothetical protein [Romboutsia lituseburensis]|uniref:hypothetical protein n=1 Tax=Romboutsia lituseburensis TaxID=1537 RepID=UPI00215B1038|nr:hypothetical protein [Romboutsia lituseburensis]MCR8746939.1 hypothetical protein [Romboutsia lituseburensis]
MEYIVSFIENKTYKIFDISDYTKSVAHQLMNSASFLVVFMSVSTILTKGILRAGGDTKFLMIADVLFLCLVSIPLGYVAAIVLNLLPYYFKNRRSNKRSLVYN